MKHKLLLVLACVLSLAILLPACGLFSGSDLERKEIISFTQQALEIETKRSQLLAYFSERQPPLVPGHFRGANWLVGLFFFKGVPANSTITNAPPSGLEGMTSLTQKVLLLDCPQSMQSIKDSLVYIYTAEMELDYTQVSSDVTQGNVTAFIESFSRFRNLYFADSPWVKLQLLRRDVYTRWAEILRQHGIDPVQEGFTELMELE